eukprot:TRINITY_DN69835_c0_g1_i1.p1 TRINITY_DN69835_c0_g1~~TRINITY_DN69835_c0_g1_i1.p1  ORF type:complete len:287 (+),score=0.14 TRINITY_DN69835_c0_g1_i1:110-862(+)
MLQPAFGDAPSSRTPAFIRLLHLLRDPSLGSLNSQWHIFNALLSQISFTDVRPFLVGHCHFGPPDAAVPFDINAFDSVRSATILSGPSFSLCVFAVPPGHTIPLHNHPSMHVIMSCVFGAVDVQPFDTYPVTTAGDEPPNGAGLPPIPPAYVSAARGDPLYVPALARRRVRLSAPPTSVYSLSPGRGALHTVSAPRGAVFVDLITPPYTNSRPCSYYAVHSLNNTTAGCETEGTDEERWALLRTIPEPVF